MNDADLRFGKVVCPFYDAAGIRVPKQLDLLDSWFPGLIVCEDKSDGETKTPAVYCDREYMIHALRYHGKLYAGGSTRISQICGRLIGTAGGNREKERLAAELIQKHVSLLFLQDMTLTPRLKEHVSEQIGTLSEEALPAFYEAVYELMWDLAETRQATDPYDRNTEPFPMDDDVFDGVLYNCGYQLALFSWSGLVCAFLWLLVGSLLRNETGRVLRMYDSSFIAVHRQASETGELTDKLHALFCPEDYYYTLDAEDKDLRHRFPDIEWYCDGCGAHLNEQAGFDDRLPAWKCTSCGTENRLDVSEIYENAEDAKNHVRPVDPAKFMDAVRNAR